jgi:hypothetical protein
MHLLLLLAFQDFDASRRGYEEIVAHEWKEVRRHEELRVAAHAALDAGRYEEAVARAKEAAAVRDGLAQTRRKLAEARAAFTTACIAALGADAVVLREEATRWLETIGAPAFPAMLRALRTERDLEAAARLRRILRGATIGTDGRVRQWAIAAKASSEYGERDWSAAQATGEPDTVGFGDQPTAWASREPDRGPEWLELEYAAAVRVTRVRVHETFNPGAVTRIEGLADDGSARVLWEGRDPGAEWLETDAAPGSAAFRRIRITLASDQVAGWNEIDAVELVGELE